MKYETIATWCFIIGGNTFVEDATDIFSDDLHDKKELDKPQVGGILKLKY